jgi:hypothetical protein
VPCDAGIRDPLGDLGLPRFLDAADVRAPSQVRVVELADLDHPLHESWKFLELRPLIVRRAHRDVDFDRLLDL